MLTLDTEQARRQKWQENFMKNQEHNKLLLRSDIANKEVTVAPDGDLSTTSLEQQLGHPLTSNEVQRRLEKMNNRLVFEIAIADPKKIGVYVIENAPDPVTKLWGTRKRYVSGMMRGWMPERTVRHMKKTRVPDPDNPGNWQEVPEYTTETRGWRQVLKMLLHERLITNTQIDAYFPANWNSKAWKTLTT